MRKYEQLYHSLCGLIDSCLQKGGEQLPTQEELCQKYQMSRVTVRRALRQLEEDGYLVTRQGSGSRLTGLSPSAEKNRIALLLSDTETSLYPSVWSSIRREAVKAGYELLLFRTEGSLWKERKALAELAGARVLPRGILAERFFVFPSPNEDLYQDLKEKGCETVFLFGEPAGDPAVYGSVRADYEKAGKDAVTLLASRGHRRIGGVFNLLRPEEAACCKGCLLALRDLGLPFPEHHFLTFGFPETGNRQKLDTRAEMDLADSFLGSVSEECTAVLCGSDLQAYGAAAALERRGVPVPDGMSIVSAGSSFLRNQSSLHMESFMPAEEFGEAAVRQLIRQMKGGPAEQILLSMEPVHGNSVKTIR